jgi:hypothetical protein
LRAEHQRNDVRPHALHHRHGEQEHHRAAVGREEAVVEVRADQVTVGAGQLEAHQRGLDAAGDEEDERRDDEAEADGGVADLAQPGEDAATGRPGRREGVRRAARVRRGPRAHRSVSR